MSWLKKELDESAKARAEQSVHVRAVAKTRTEHLCHFCKHKIDIGESARVVSEENIYNYRSFYKTYYYHTVCFLSSEYSEVKPKHE